MIYAPLLNFNAIYARIVALILLSFAIGCISTDQYDIDGNELYTFNESEYQESLKSELDSRPDYIYVEDDNTDVKFEFSTNEIYALENESKNTKLNKTALSKTDISPSEQQAYYIVRAGDSLSKISQALYGDFKKWPSLSNLNNKKNPHLIYPGEIIHLDSKQLVDQNLRYLAKNKKNNVKTVTVKKGDTLSSIAQKSLGKIAEWKSIWQANKIQINNPNLIYPGMQLAIDTKEEGFIEEYIVHYKTDKKATSPPNEYAH